jgi:hypothetical protein
MSKTWQPHQYKRFARDVVLGRTYYVALDIATNLAPYEDAQLYREHVFTERSGLTGTPRTDGGTTATELCRNWGPVYDAAPAGMRRLGGPAPQVGAPLGSNNYEGRLDEAELRGLEKQVGQGSDPRKRRPLGSWRV